jgi:hypothetical protein
VQKYVASLLDAFLESSAEVRPCRPWLPSSTARRREPGHEAAEVRPAPRSPAAKAAELHCLSPPTTEVRPQGHPRLRLPSSAT